MALEVSSNLFMQQIKHAMACFEEKSSWGQDGETKCVELGEIHWSQEVDAVASLPPPSCFVCLLPAVLI